MTFIYTESKRSLDITKGRNAVRGKQKISFTQLLNMKEPNESYII